MKPKMPKMPKMSKKPVKHAMSSYKHGLKKPSKGLAYKGKETPAEEAAEEKAEHGLTMGQMKRGARIVGKSAVRGARKVVRKAGKAMGKAAKSMARLPGKMIGKAGMKMARKAGKTVGKAVHKARLSAGRKVLFGPHPVSGGLKKAGEKVAKARNVIGRKLMGLKKGK